jgi:AcrR family transcriptional regulator
MKRKIHKENIKNKILHTARRLFISQGYNATTIRQIIGECDIKIGTIYHFYKDKEDILLHIAEKIFNHATTIADKDIEVDDSCLRFVKEITSHLNLIVNDPQSKELYVVSYNSSTISKRIIEKRVERNKELFSKYNPDFTEEDYVSRAFFIKGFLQAISMEKGLNNEINSKIITAKSIKIMLNLFNVPHEEIQRVLTSINEFIDE